MEEKEVIEIAKKLQSLTKHGDLIDESEFIQAAATIQLTKTLKQAFMLDISGTIPVLETIAMVIKSNR